MRKLGEADSFPDSLGEEYLYIVLLEQLGVEHKSTLSLTAKKENHQRVSKKQFCCLLKNAILVRSGETPPAAVVGV